MNARDVAYGYALGINDSSGGGNIGEIKAVLDDDSSSLSLIFKFGDKLKDFNFTYSTKTITKSITTTSSSGETTTTKTTTWSITLIDKLFSADGVLVMSAVYSDESNGVISHYLNADGGKIYKNGDYTSEGITIDEALALDGAKIKDAAITYSIAKNNSSFSSLEETMNAYRKGVVDGNNGHGEIVEPYDTAEPPTFSVDEDGNCIDPAITDMFNGGVFVCGGDAETGEINRYYRVYLLPYSWEPDEYTAQKNKIMIDLISSDGTTETRETSSYQYEKSYSYERTLTKFELYKNYFYAVYEQKERSTGKIEIQRTYIQVYSSSTDFLKYTNVKPF